MSTNVPVYNDGSHGESITVDPAEVVAAPFTEETLDRMLELYMNRPSPKTGKARMAKSTINMLQSTVKFFRPMLLSGETGDQLLLALLEGASVPDAPTSYRTHYFHRFLIPFLEFSGRITDWQAMQWRKRMTRYKPVKHSSEKILEPQELADLFRYARAEAIRRGRPMWKTYLFLATMYLTGARISQVNGIEYPDGVDFENNDVNLLLPKKKTAAGGYLSFTIPMSTPLPNGDTYGLVISTYLRMMDDGADYLFCSEADPANAVTNMGKILRSELYQPLGLDTFNHAFRALVATTIANSDGIHAAQRYLGHASVSTTQRYIKQTRPKDFTRDVTSRFAAIINDQSKG